MIDGCDRPIEDMTMSSVTSHRVLAASLLAIAAFAFGAATALAAEPTVIVSLPDRQSGSGNGGQALPTATLSHDGRHVAFTSRASGLSDPEPNPNDQDADVYLRDVALGTTIRISNPADGGDYANAGSGSPRISANGRVIAFLSSANDLVAGDEVDSQPSIFLHDLDTHRTVRIDITNGGPTAHLGSTGPALSADGGHVAFHSKLANLVDGDVVDDLDDIFVHDVAAGLTTKITAGANGFSNSSSIAGDGRRIAFTSRASNLSPLDTDGSDDVYVYDRDADTMILASVGLGDAEPDSYSRSPAISADGRFVAFTSHATNLVAGDANGFVDVFVRDLELGVTELISRGHDGAGANEASYAPCISADGRIIAFHSDASNLVPGDIVTIDPDEDRDVFIYDRDTGSLRIASIAFDGGPGDDYAENCGVSGDGRYVAYESEATNLVEDDPNGDLNDIFRVATGGDTIFTEGFEHPSPPADGTP